MKKKIEKEIEIKLLFNNKKEIISALPTINFCKKIKVRDRYYSQKYSDIRNTHQIIRIRQKFNIFSELTYKGKTKDYKNIWYRKEITTLIKDPRKMHKILILLGFRKIRDCLSEREYWLIDDVEIVFSKFTKPALLEFMEIESDSHEKIRQIVKRLGNRVKEVGEEIFDVFDKTDF